VFVTRNAGYEFPEHADRPGEDVSYINGRQDGALPWRNARSQDVSGGQSKGPCRRKPLGGEGDGYMKKLITAVLLAPFPGVAEIEATAREGAA
jgi:hypothetical protein